MNDCFLILLSMVVTYMFIIASLVFYTKLWYMPVPKVSTWHFFLWRRGPDLNPRQMEISPANSTFPSKSLNIITCHLQTISRAILSKIYQPKKHNMYCANRVSRHTSQILEYILQDSRVIRTFDCNLMSDIRFLKNP